MLKFLSSGVSPEDYEVIRHGIYDENRRSLKICSIIFTVSTFVLSLLTVVISSIRDQQTLLIAATVAGLVFCALSWIADSKFILTICHLFAYSVIAVGILIDTVFSRNNLASVFFVFIVAIPIIFTDKTVRSNFAIIGCSAAFIITDCNFKTDRELLIIDLLCAVVFLIISLVLNTHMTKIKFQRHIFEYKNRLLSDFDALTGLRSRNNYETRLDSYYDGKFKESIACVFLDVNGLHELNNTKGHEAGDRMLGAVSKEFIELFGNSDSYRIGGDEYVAFILDRDESYVGALIRALGDKVDAMGYHVACGYDIQKAASFDVRALVAQAEKNMFKNKSDYYHSIGDDRYARTIDVNQLG